MRDRVFVWIAWRATRLANRFAEPFHGDRCPYWFMAPNRNPEPEFDPTVPGGPFGI